MKKDFSVLLILAQDNLEALFCVKEPEDLMILAFRFIREIIDLEPNLIDKN